MTALPSMSSRPANGTELLEELTLRAATAGLRIQCPPDGSFNAQVAIVAEAPGEREVQARSPLVGGAGNILWQYLRRYGIDRRSCWVTNVCKRQVSLSRETDDRDVVPRGEAEHWEGLLRWELSALPNLRYVLVLGGPALAAVSDHKGIENWRGTVEYKDGIWFVYSYNPANILRKGSLEPVFGLDIWKLDAVMRGKYVPHDITAHINPSPSEALRWLERMRDERLPVSVDIETAGNETACVGFANTAYEGMCINFRTGDHTHAYSVADEQRVRLGIASLVQHPDVRLVAQNGSFDAGWLGYKDKIIMRPVWFDTLLAHHTLYPLLPHNLGFLTSQYTWHPYYKDEKTAWRELATRDIDRYWRYNVTDACITHAVHARLYNELVQQKLDTFFFQHVMRLQPHLIKMQIRGVLCDVPLKQKITEDSQADVDRLRQEFYDAVHVATGDDTYNPNPNSPAQMKKLFFDKLRLVGRGVSVDEENRKRMIQHPATPDAARKVIGIMDKLKKEDKFLGTYAKMEVDPDNRVRSEYKQFGTTRAPGRLSSSGTLWGSGANLQNQPERAKEMFIADEDMCLVYFDLGQAESRFVGWDANIPMWIEQYERARMEGGYDAHRALASEMFKVPYDQVPEKDHDENGNFTIRYKAKRCRHGLNYRMGPEELATQLGVPLGEAMTLYSIYHRTNPELRKWWARLEKEAKDTKRLYTPYGRRLLFQGRIDDKTLESIVAFRPQSTIGDHVSGTIYLCEEDERWPKNQASIVLNIHDALIALCRTSVASTVAAIMKEHAERPILVNGRPLIIPADLAVSVTDHTGKRRWSTLKKAKTIADIPALLLSA